MVPKPKLREDRFRRRTPGVGQSVVSSLRTIANVNLGAWGLNPRARSPMAGTKPPLTKNLKPITKLQPTKNLKPARKQ